MGFTYKIVYTATFDRFTGLPIPYRGPPVTPEHRLFLKNQEEWNNRFGLILFPDIPDGLVSVRVLLEQIRPYNDIAESLVDANLHRYWTREKHEQFLRAFRFFADQGFDITFW